MLLLSVPVNCENNKKEVYIIRSRTVNNGYNPAITNKLMKKKQKKIQKQYMNLTHLNQ